MIISVLNYNALSSIVSLTATVPTNIISVGYLKKACSLASICKINSFYKGSEVIKNAIKIASAMYNSLHRLASEEEYYKYPKIQLLVDTLLF